ncbi:unnamed protein product, partial [Mesorhabditis spiculigera]
MTALEPSLRLWSPLFRSAGIGADHIDTTVVRSRIDLSRSTKNGTRRFACRRSGRGSGAERRLADLSLTPIPKGSDQGLAVLVRAFSYLRTTCVRRLRLSVIDKLTVRRKWVLRVRADHEVNISA